MNEALENLKAALIDGLPVEQALNEIAQDYEVNVAVLRNRALKAFGDLETVRARELSFKSKAQEQQQAVVARREERDRRSRQAFSDLLAEAARNGGDIGLAARTLMIRDRSKPA